MQAAVQGRFKASIKIQFLLLVPGDPGELRDSIDDDLRIRTVLFLRCPFCEALCPALVDDGLLFGLVRSAGLALSLKYLTTIYILLSIFGPEY